jgi:hypothetical protein
MLYRGNKSEHNWVINFMLDCFLYNAMMCNILYLLGPSKMNYPQATGYQLSCRTRSGIQFIFLDSAKASLRARLQFIPHLMRGRNDDSWLQG